VKDNYAAKSTCQSKAKGYSWEFFSAKFFGLKITPSNDTKVVGPVWFYMPFYAKSQVSG
jgi:hypothetical protein